MNPFFRLLRKSNEQFFVLCFILLYVPGRYRRGQPRPAFDVASIKPVDMSTLGDSISMNIGTVRHEEVTFGNATLNDCIRFAYGMASDAEISGPDWIKSKRFLYDIDAKGAPGSSSEQLQAMMQALLAERFKLATHREQKEMSYYALEAAKGGAKIRRVAEKPDGFRGQRTAGVSTAFCPCLRWLTYYPASRQIAPSSIKSAWAVCTK